MSDKPEALRLADILEKMPLGECDEQAAAELRRLHALNAELVEVLQRYHRIVIANAIDLDCDAAIDKAHAALAKAEASNG